MISKPSFSYCFSCVPSLEPMSRMDLCGRSVQKRESTSRATLLKCSCNDCVISEHDFLFHGVILLRRVAVMAKDNLKRIKWFGTHLLLR